MKFKVLIKENINKTYNVLQIIKKNKNLILGHDLFSFYNSKNWFNVFSNAYSKFAKNEIDGFIVIDDYGYGPFLFFSKQKNLIAGLVFNATTASLTRAHNDSRVCIIPIKDNNIRIHLNEIISNFCVTKFDGGRHATRLEIVNKSMSNTKNGVVFSKKNNKTVVVGSDHAGYELKEAIKRKLESRGYTVIDVGTKNTKSTHYPLFGLAMASHINKSNFAIGICWTGIGMANSLNKFKGIKACICNNAKDVNIAKNLFDCNTLVISSKTSTKQQALKIVDTYLKLKGKKDSNYKIIDCFGFRFDKNKFKKIKISKNILIPNELK